MKISDLVKRLENIKDDHGDIMVYLPDLFVNQSQVSTAQVSGNNVLILSVGDEVGF